MLNACHQNVSYACSIAVLEYHNKNQKKDGDKTPTAEEDS